MLLTAVIIGSLVGCAIAAMILTTACTLVRVQAPDFFFGMVICFLVAMTSFVVLVLAGAAGTVGAGISLASLRSALDYQRLLERGAGIGFLLSPFVTAGIYSSALRECSYRRALLIWVAQFVVVALFILGLWALVTGLGLAGRH